MSTEGVRDMIASVAGESVAHQVEGVLRHLCGRSGLTNKFDGHIDSNTTTTSNAKIDSSDSD